MAALAGCRHVPTEKEQEGSRIHYDLGVQAQGTGDTQGAYNEFEKALELDPGNAEAHNAAAILLHLAFRRPDEAIAHYKRALAIRPTFSEAKTNLANVYLEQSRYDEAIKLYEEALNDMLYPTPYIAESNLGWAFYKKGDLKRAIENIRAAVTTNPKFCLGYKNLGIILEEQGNVADACHQYGKYKEACPETAEAYFREGRCLAKQDKAQNAKQDFAACQAKATDDALKEDCRRLLELLQ